MSYWQLLYHLVWATKDRQPLLVAEVEPLIHDYLRSRGTALGGAILAVSGTPDHVHLVVAIPPRMAVATFVCQLKSSSSGRFNRQHPDRPRFAWQESYGVLSFDRKGLANLVDYVEAQPRIHAEGRTIPALERTQGGMFHLARESADSYYIDDQAWRREMLALDTELFL